MRPLKALRTVCGTVAGTAVAAPQWRATFRFGATSRSMARHVQHGSVYVSVARCKRAPHAVERTGSVSKPLKVEPILSAAATPSRSRHVAASKAPERASRPARGTRHLMMRRSRSCSCSRTLPCARYRTGRNGAEVRDLH